MLQFTALAIILSDYSKSQERFSVNIRFIAMCIMYPYIVGNIVQWTQ